MINPKLARCLRNVVPLMQRDLTSRLSSSPFASHHDRNPFHHFLSRQTLVSEFHHSMYRPPKTSSTFDLPFASRLWYSTTTTASTEDIQCQNHRESPQSDTDDEVESIDYSEEEDEDYTSAGDTDYDEEPFYFWEKEREPNPEIVLNNCPWGKKVLDMACFAWDCSLNLTIRTFVASPNGGIYVKLDRLMDADDVAADMDQVEEYFYEYKRRLDKAGAIGEIPSNLYLEVSADDFEGRSYSYT